MARAGDRPSRRLPGTIPELFPLDLLLEDPSAGEVEVADLDLVTGRLNPDKLGDRCRPVYLPKLRSGEKRDQR